MEGGKPLIFIKPYTKTLAKLKEVLEESSEQQGTEIYEIDDLQEAIQLIPQIGQSLVIAAHPRKTAMLLQASRVHIKKLQTKVLLISPKPIPRRTVDKFMKVGLTECIVEPIVPKTLQYKVNLLIRSIVIKKEEGSFEKKFDADSQANDDSDIEIKEMQRRMREGLDAANGSSQSSTSDEEDLYGKKEKTYREEEIAGYYKGKMKKPGTTANEEDDEAPSNPEDHIESYYKGKLAQSENSEEENTSDETDDLDIEDDDVHALASKVNLLLDDEDETENDPKVAAHDEHKTKKKAPALTLEEEQEKKLKKQIEESTADLGDLASHHLELIDDLSDNKEEPSKKEGQVQAPKKATSNLDIEEEQKQPEEKIKKDKAENFSPKEKSKLQLEEDDHELAQEQQDRNEKEKSTKNKVSLELTDEKNEEELETDTSQEANVKDKKAKVSITLEQDPPLEPEEEASVEEQLKEAKNSSKVQIDLEEDLYASNKEEAVTESNEDPYKKAKKNLNIECDLDHDYGEIKRKKKEARERELATDLDIEDDTDRNRKRGEQAEDNYQTRSSGFTENIQDRGGNRADAHSDKIQTHYDSRKGLKHGDDEWKSTEREKHFDDNWKHSKANEFIMPEKEAFGEQTIDYTDLKKQFDAIEYDLSGKKKVGEFDEKNSAPKPLGFAAAISTDTDSSEELLEEQVPASEGDQERPIQEAHLKTGPTLIKGLRLYLLPNLDREKVLNGILELLRDDLGVLVAIKYGKGPHDGKLKVDTFEGWLDTETRNTILGYRTSSTSCPLLPTYSDKTYEQKKTTFYYPFTEGIATFAWAECYLPAGTDEDGLKGIEAVLESARGALLDEFHELGGTGSYAEIRKKKTPEESPGAKVMGFFGKLFGKKKAS